MGAGMVVVVLFALCFAGACGWVAYITARERRKARDEDRTG